MVWSLNCCHIVLLDQRCHQQEQRQNVLVSSILAFAIICKTVANRTTRFVVSLKPNRTQKEISQKTVDSAHYSYFVLLVFRLSFFLPFFTLLFLLFGCCCCCCCCCYLFVCYLLYFLKYRLFIIFSFFYLLCWVGTALVKKQIIWVNYIYIYIYKEREGRKES